MKPSQRHHLFLTMALAWGLSPALFAQTSTFTSTNSPTPTFTKTPTKTATNSFTPTFTRTITNTPTQTLTKTLTGTPTHSLTPTASFTATDSFTPNPTLTPPCASANSFGVSTATLLGSATTTMRASMISLNKPATLYSLWLYSGNPGAQVMTGIYGGGLGNIGSLIVPSSAQTMISGWNGFPITPTYLAPGNYWLAYVYKTGGYGVYEGADTGAMILAYTSGAVAFGSMPVSMPAAIAYGTIPDSIYAVFCYAPTATPTVTSTPTNSPTATITGTSTPTGTLTPFTPTFTISFTPTKTFTNTNTYTATPTPNVSLTPDCGASAVQFGDANTSGGPVTTGTISKQMLAYRYNMPTDGTVETISLFATTADAGITASVALYSNNAATTVMQTLVAQSPVSQILTSGWNVFRIPNSLVAAGDYWLACIVQSSAVSFSFPADYTSLQSNCRAFSSSVASFNFLTSAAGYSPSYVGDFHEPMMASYCPGVFLSPTPSATFTSTSSPTPTLTGTITPNTPTPTLTTTFTMTPDLSLTPDCGASALLFGDTNSAGVTSVTSASAEMWSTRYTMPSAGTIETISLYTLPTNAGFQANVALYANDAATTTMSNLIAQSGGASGIPQVLYSGWNTFKIPNSPVTAGDYWLTFIFSSFPVTGYSITYQTTGPFANSSAYVISPPSWTYPSSLPTPNWPVTYVTQGLFPIYANYCPATSTTPTYSPTVTFTPTITPTPTITNSPTLTNTPTITSTFTISPTPTITSTSTNSFTATLTGTPTNSPTVTPTPTNSLTPTATSTATDSYTPTATFSFTPSPTMTATFSPTNSPTVTFTPTSTATLTFTLTGTLSPTLSPTPTASSTPTNSLTSTATLSPTNSPTPTPSATLSASPTNSLTSSATATASPTVSPTLTITATPSLTRTFTPAATATFTPTPNAVINKTASEAVANTGDTITYTIALTVTGGPVTNIVVSDLLPAHLDLIGFGSVPTGGSTNWNPSNRTLGWSIPVLAPGTYSISYQAQVDSGAQPGTVLTNGAQLTYNGLTSPKTTSVEVTMATTGPVLFPNPVKGRDPVSLRVVFGKTQDDVSIKVFTTAFRKVYDDTVKSVPEGIFLYGLDPDHFKGSAANGLYYVEVKTPSNRWISKLLVLR